MFNRWIEGELLQTLAEEGMGCIVFSPLAQGVLTGRYLDGIPAGSRASKPHGFLRPEQITNEKLAKVRALHAVAQLRGQSLAQMAIGWVLRHPGVTSAVIGASSVVQLDENLQALEKPAFQAEELAEIERILTS
jgi:L-glyceraldehyde 3-phosphate reductase